MALARVSWLTRLLRPWLTRGRGEVRALEDALHIEQILRVGGLFGATILLPTALLVWFGLAGVSSGDQRVAQDVQREAMVTADTFWAQADRGFSALERRVRERLEAGRSPVDSPGELHPQLLLALRFDQEGRLRAPFVVDDRPLPGLWSTLDPALRAAEGAERAGQPPAEVAALYARAAALQPTPGAQGRALFDEARQLEAAGRSREAARAYALVLERHRADRDPWGFRLGDLARLRLAREHVARSPAEGVEQLRLLVDDLLAERWTVDRGGEAAVAAEALAVAEAHARDAEWIAAARGRVAERSAQLYWAGALMDELQPLLADDSLRVSDGEAIWRAGRRALWVTTPWAGETYAFGLDLEAVLSQLKADARASVVADADVAAWLLGPGEAPPAQILATKTLAPWLTGWSVVVAPRDPDALAAARRAERDRGVFIILVAAGLIGVGTLATVRMVKRELDGARMQADFAASVSHELRSPITHIRIQGESLLLQLADTDEERHEAYVSIVRESERLSRLVDNVLDFAAIERGAKRYLLREGDIVDTVLRALDSISSAQEVQDKELDADLPADLPPVFHDGDAIAQCVINLVSNAAKYSPPSGWIGVRGRRVEGGVEITVSDKGIGIAAHDLRQIFEPFYRSRDAQARRRKGTGIGLTITRYIMRAHGGDVLVQSRPGQGSTFTLRFPLRPPPELLKG